MFSLYIISVSSYEISKHSKSLDIDNYKEKISLIISGAISFFTFLPSINMNSFYSK